MTFYRYDNDAFNIHAYQLPKENIPRAPTAGINKKLEVLSEIKK